MTRVFDRLLVVFARAPRSEARDKGLPEEPATGFFTEIAREWREAASRAGARLAISAPSEDLPAWRRALPDCDDVVWIGQRGSTFGARLEDASRRAGRLARHVVVTGGDVVPSAVGLSAAFGALATGAEAVIAPAPDGGVSMLSLPGDSDLLRPIGRRRRDVFRSLRSRLLSRGRAVRVVASIADVDGPGALRNVIVTGGLEKLVSQLRRACRLPMPRETPAASARPAPARSSAILRGPPLPA
jgi:glycosyltransferase A (GT-A) superfamily protein (DUF2064 family)